MMTQEEQSLEGEGWELAIKVTLKSGKIQLMTSENMRSERETEAFLDFLLCQTTFY